MLASMEPQPATPPPPGRLPSRQAAARTALAVAIVAFAVWILHEFLPALAWAGVLAIALWPLYHRLLAALPHGAGRALGPLLATALVTLVIMTPLVWLGIAVVRESHVVAGFISEARQHGVPPPAWLGRLPVAGSGAAQWWHETLGDPHAAAELVGRIDAHAVAETLRRYGGEVAHRAALLLFTLLALFFAFRDGSALAGQLLRLGDRTIGERGERVAAHVVAAVHGTVNGLVLVGLAEGILLGIAYAAVGLPYAGSVGAITAVAAMIPFAAPVVYGLAGLYLLAAGDTIGGVVILAVGSAIVFVADHFVRPYLIGGAARLPFLLVLLGTLGGLRTMGFLGLFLGPAGMAALVALWREWTEPPVAEPEPPISERRGER